MGYTHYWTFTPSQVLPNTWEQAVDDCRRILKTWQAENNTVAGRGGYRIGVQEKNGLIGVYGGCESFHILVRIEAADEGERIFCKTNRYGYDTPIVACLARLAMTQGITVSSDGGAHEWEPGLDYASRVLGWRVPCPPALAGAPAFEAEAQAEAQDEVSRLQALVAYWEARARAAESLAGI
jgi:hypothetical protein